jgi:hypothetical protein
MVMEDYWKVGSQSPTWQKYLVHQDENVGALLREGFKGLRKKRGSLKGK